MNVSRAAAEAERERIVRIWPQLAGRVAVMELESAPGSFALRVSGESSWRVVHIGSGEHESRAVFAEAPPVPEPRRVAGRR